MNSAKTLVAGIALAIFMIGVAGCVVSKFSLAADSRLPVWFTLPKGVQRDDVIVTLSYVTTAVTPENTVMEMRSVNGEEISKIRAIECLHPIMEAKKNSKGGFDPDSFPHYRIIRANGKTEIVEHRMEPIFRIVDDPSLRASLPEGCQHD